MDKVHIHNPYDTSNPTRAFVVGTYTDTTSVPDTDPSKPPVTTDVDVRLCIVPDHAIAAPDGSASIVWRLVTDDQLVSEDGSALPDATPETGNGDGAWYREHTGDAS